jgi:hypothetical protein
MARGHGQPAPPVSWSPRGGRFDRSGRSSTAGPPSSRSPSPSARAATSRGAPRAHAPAPPWQPLEARRVPERLAVQHHDIAPLWPPANSSLHLEHARHDRWRPPLGRLVPAHRRRAAPRAHNQLCCQRPGVAQGPHFRPRRPRGIGTSSSPMITLQLLPGVLPRSPRTTAVALHRSLISQHSPARRPTARGDTADRRCDEEIEPLNRGGASERKQTRGPSVTPRTRLRGNGRESITIPSPPIRATAKRCNPSAGAGSRPVPAACGCRNRDTAHPKNGSRAAANRHLRQPGRHLRHRRPNWPHRPDQALPRGRQANAMAQVSLEANG